MINTIMAKLIQLLHIILVIGLVLSIFINSFPYKHLALIFLMFLLLHYITNNNVCMLTELEYYFLGEKYQEGFLHRLIKPVLTTPEKYNEKYMYLLHIIWIYILFIQLYESNYFSDFYSFFIINKFHVNKNI